MIAGQPIASSAIAAKRLVAAAGGDVTQDGVAGALVFTGQSGNGVVGYSQTGDAGAVLITGQAGQGSITASGANGALLITGLDGNGVVGFTQSGVSASMLFTGNDGQGVATGQDVEYGSGPFTYPHALRKRKQEAEEQLTEQVKRTIRRIAKGVIVGKAAKEELGQIKDFASLTALRRSVEFYEAIDKSLAMRKAQDNIAAQEAVRLFIVEMERRAQQIEEDDIAFLMMQVVADID